MLNDPHATRVAASPYELVVEHEMWTAPRRATEHLFHYTSADTAIDHILRKGTLRLSPYERMNDLWESQPHYPVISAHHDEKNVKWDHALWSQIDQLRLHTKMSCLTQDYALPENVLSRDAFRGWAHLALWAHYGDGHRGVCLRFDRDRLIEAFDRYADSGLLAFRGPVMYVGCQTPPATDGVDLGQIIEFGVDAAALFYAQQSAGQLFFRKHIDWDNESEYRLVLVNESTDFDEFDMRDALTGVVVGSRFPEAKLAGLRSALESYPEVRLEQVLYMNRTFLCVPFEGLPAETAPVTPAGSLVSRRGGPVDERFAALSTAEAEATVGREEGKAAAADLVAMLERGLVDLASALSPLPEAKVEVLPRVLAVPEHQRARKPGVPGEQIHFQGGFMCVVENQPAPSHTLVAAAALQVLDGKRLRLHAVVSTEDRDGDRIERGEPWRAVEEVALPEATPPLIAMLGNLLTAVRAERARFDERRGLEHRSS